MDRTTRKDLKTDRFAVQVGHSLEYVTDHRKQAIRYGGIGLAVILLSVSGFNFFKNRSATRQSDLATALRSKEGVIGAVPQPGDPRPSFPTQADKDKAVQKAFQDVITNHPGTNEAAVAAYQLGSIAADGGKLAEAAKHFQVAIQSGDNDYASVSKLSLAQVYQAEGKLAEAEKLLRELMNSPTILVSKEQATFSLVRVLAAKNPAEGHKIIEPLLKDERPAVARNASALQSELPLK